MSQSELLKISIMSKLSNVEYSPCCTSNPLIVHMNDQAIVLLRGSATTKLATLRPDSPRTFDDIVERVALTRSIVKSTESDANALRVGTAALLSNTIARPGAALCELLVADDSKGTLKVVLVESIFVAAERVENRDLASVELSRSGSSQDSQEANGQEEDLEDHGGF